MNAAIVIQVLNVILTILQTAGITNKTVENVIKFLENVLPLISDTWNDVAEPVKNIISVLKSSDAVTEEQIAQLDLYEMELDKKFDGVSQSYLSAHPLRQPAKEVATPDETKKATKK